MHSFIITIMCALIAHAPHPMCVVSTTDTTVTASALNIETTLSGEMFITDSIVIEFDSIDAVIDTLYMENA